MQVKRYVAANMQRALEMVRSDLGADAIILSNRRVKKGVEILTTLEGGFDQKDPVTEDKENADWQDAMLMQSDDVMGVASKRSEEQLRSGVNTRRKAESSAPSLPTEIGNKKVLSEHKIKDAVPEKSFSRGIPEHLQEEIAQAREKMFAAKRLSESNEGMQAPTVTSSTMKAPFPQALEAAAQKQVFQSELDVTREENNNPQLESALMDLIVQGAKEDDRQMNPANYIGDASSKIDAKINPGVTAVPQASCVSVSEAPGAGELADMKAELRNMRGLLQQQLEAGSWGQFSNSSPVQAALWQKLHLMGLSPTVVKNIIDRINHNDSFANAWKSALALLMNDLGCIDGDCVKKGGVFAFVGPTGVGKTTTIGKLAARYVLKNGSDSIALVTTDSYRIAAHEQLKAFSTILDIPLKVAHHPSELAGILDSFSDKTLVLIDTAGLNSQDDNLNEQLMSLKQLDKRISTLMVLATTAQRSVMQAAVKNYGIAGLNGFVLTKLDEVMSLGESFSTVIESRLPIAYFTDGQTIPDDLHIVRPKKLINRAIALSKQKNTAPEDVAGSFTSVLKPEGQIASAFY